MRLVISTIILFVFLNSVAAEHLDLMKQETMDSLCITLGVLEKLEKLEGKNADEYTVRVQESIMGTFAKDKLVKFNAGFWIRGEKIRAGDLILIIGAPAGERIELFDYPQHSSPILDQLYSINLIKNGEYQIIDRAKSIAKILKEKDLLKKVELLNKSLLIDKDEDLRTFALGYLMHISTYLESTCETIRKSSQRVFEDPTAAPRERLLADSILGVREQSARRAILFQIIQQLTGKSELTDEEKKVLQIAKERLGAISDEK